MDNLESHFISKNNRGAVALIKTFSTLISKRGILARQRQGKPAFKLLYLQAEAVVEELLTYVDSNNAVKEIASLIILAKLDNIESYSSSWELKTILAGNRKNLHLDAEELSNVAPNVKDHPYSQIVREPVQQSAMMTQGPLNQQNNSRCNRKRSYRSTIVCKRCGKNGHYGNECRTDSDPQSRQQYTHSHANQPYRQRPHKAQRPSLTANNRDADPAICNYVK
mmetsp:Transcript_10697/g.21070  ORF Transcript_10697/g.21070 Transcript_10697/m.21070 type:complete len:223 (-) Transcript_10697:28-696(-)